MGPTRLDIHADGARQTDPLFDGPGEMRALCRAYDWSATPLGDSLKWPVSLRTTVGIVLGSLNPMFLWYGPELTQIYNDAYRPSLGGGSVEESRHPRALGSAGAEFWTDIWEAIGPQIEQVLSTGAATWHEDQYLPIERNGRLEDVWWTYSYSPAFDDAGEVSGVLVVCQETTKRVQSEVERERLLEDVARAKQRAETILDQVADEHMTMDREMRILTVNRAALQALGKPRESLVGLTHGEAFPASVGSAVERQYQRVIAERTEVHITHHYLGDGYDRHLEIDAYPTLEDGVAVFWRDISDRKKAEAALRESESRYHALFESIDEGLCIIEVMFDEQDRPVDYRFLQTNPAFEIQTGLVNAIGRTAREMVPDLEQHWFEIYGSVASTGETVRLEQGSEPMGRWFDLNAFRIGTPEDRRVAILFKDVSATRSAALEREKLLRALDVERSRLFEVFQQSPTFLAVLRGPDHVFELVNEAYNGLTGHRPLVGKSLLDAMPEIEGQGFTELLDHVLASREPFVGRELPVLLARTPGAEPEERFIDFVYLPLEDDEQVVVAHGHDVTEQVRSRREIERLLKESESARAEAEAANRVKAQFLTNMSHELRTPLNAIAGYTQLLQMAVRGPVTDEQQEFLERIQQSQQHLLGLINEVLNFAKLETGSVHFDMTDVSVHSVLSEAEAMVAPQAQSRGITFHPLACDESLRARADAEKLRQVMVNLLSNAVKFTEAGGSITVNARADGDAVRISVTDTGIGIPEERLDDIFDPFVQVRSDLKRPYEGTGLGLAISRELARAMGGELRVESRLGIGSTFTLVLGGIT